jgi:hypothetical protein
MSDSGIPLHSLNLVTQVSHSIHLTSQVDQQLTFLTYKHTSGGHWTTAHMTEGDVAPRMRRVHTETRTNSTCGTRKTHTDAGDGMSQLLGIAVRLVPSKPPHKCMQNESRNWESNCVNGVGSTAPRPSMAAFMPTRWKFTWWQVRRIILLTWKLVQ